MDPATPQDVKRDAPLFLSRGVLRFFVSPDASP